MAEKPRYPLPKLPTLPLGSAVPVNDLPIPGTFIPQPPPRKTIDEVMRGLSYGISQDIGQAGDSVARALMTPGNALRGDYNEVSIYPSGYVSPVSEALIQDASNMAGVVTTGSMPMPRPMNSLGMGGSVKEYGMSHRPNTVQQGMTLDNPLYAYGDDIYSPMAQQYYGTLDKIADRESLKAISTARSNPQEMITVYRAIPNDIDASINPGDWVTTSRKYAQDHGEGWLQGNYKIVEKKVPAGQLATSGDSIHEWGWWP